jgi:hypothetical protein
MATRATVFYGEPQNSGQSYRDPNLNENARSIHLWKAGMMYIIPVPSIFTLDFHGLRNQRLKNLVFIMNSMDFKN